jgi:Flp pilus assembly protein TadG
LRFFDTEFVGVMKTITRRFSEQDGQAVVLAAFLLFALLAVLGLAVDLGRFVVVKAQLSKAVDAAALSGARVLPTGRPNAQAAAYEYGEMNFDSGFMGTTSHGFAVSFSPDPTEATVHVNGTTDMPTTFLRLVGIREVIVRAEAEAERRPLSIAMVLDNTQSLREDFNGVDAIGYLKNAAQSFVGFFDDDMDKMSLVLFSTGTELRFPLGHDFSGKMKGQVQSMQALSFTNLSDGFIAGRQQLENDPDAASFRALVFFTDGRPTALRGVYPVDGVSYDAVITGKQDPAPGEPVYDELYAYDKLDHKFTPPVSYKASTFPNGMPRTTANLQALASFNFLQAATAARREGITVFAIGLGNPRVTENYKKPDGRLLMEIANVREGVDPVTGEPIANPSYDPNQPEGGFYFAPDADQLDAVFEQVAREIVLRLTK